MMDKRIILWILMLCPAPFRRRYSPEVLQVYSTQKALDLQGNEAASISGLFLKTVGGLLYMAISLRLEPLWRDVHFALRQMRRRPGFSAAVILTLAAGIGVSTALFGLFSSVLLKPLPLHEPERLVMVWNDYAGMRTVVSAADYHYRWNNAKSLTGMAAAGVEQSFAVTGDNEPVSISGVSVSSNFFDVAGIQPFLGRGFVAEEDEVGKGQVVIIGQGFWERRYGGRESVLGDTISVDGEARVIVGVMPQTFEFPYGTTEIWRPLELSADVADYSQHGDEFIATFARLRPGTTSADAQSELDKLAQQFKQLVPDRQTYLDNSGWGAMVQPMDDYLRGDVRRALSMLLGAAALVLLLVCANVTSLQLARVSDRRSELAVRGALGASHSRVVRQLLTEIGLMVTMGGLIGLGLIWVFEATTLQMVPDLIESGDLFAAPVLLFGVGVIVVTGLVCGVLPARTFQGFSSLAGRGNLCTRKTQTMRRLTVVVQTAIAVVLVFAASASVSHLRDLVGVNPGFDSQDRFAFRLKLPSASYPSSEQRAAFVARLESSLSDLGSIIAVGANGSLPLLDNNWTASFNVEHFTPGPEQPPPNFEFRPITPTYRAAMGIELLRGRDFSDLDHATALPVAIIDETLARTYFSDIEPVGQRVGIDNDDDGVVEWREVVGVVGHVRNSGLDVQGAGQVYYPYAQAASRSPWFVLHSSLTPKRVKEVISGVLYDLDPALPIDKFTSIGSGIASALSQVRLSSTLLGAFAALAFTLAMVGVYSLVNYSVTVRRREFGLKMALGADSRAITRGVISDGLKLTILGSAIGAGGAILLGEVLESVVVGLESGSLQALALVCLALCATAGCASAVPAIRAGKTNPARALQEV